MLKKDLIETLVNKISAIIILFILASCSLDTKSGIWTQEKKIQETNRNVTVTEVFKKKNILSKEINPNITIKFISFDNLIKKKNFLSNNLGILDFRNNIDKFSKFKFSKINNFSYFDPEIVYDGKNFIFFDDKANLIKFDNEFNSVWKKNFYSEKERKLKPILTLASSKTYLVVTDNIGKIYSVNIQTGNLIWSKTNFNPFNSQVKIYKDKVFAMDINNILRCFSLKNGKELWKFNSENTFLKSNKRNSLIIHDGVIFFNNSLGDITAVNTDNGKLIWQTPTQSSDVYENAFGLIMSDLVFQGENIFFSNNRNEFYSLNKSNGFLNWKKNINSNIRPIIYENFVFTFSNEGYFFVINKKSGDIIRSTFIFNNFKQKKRIKIKPVGFILGKEKIMLSTNNGRLLIINVKNGKVEKILKIDNNKISRPFVFNKSIILVKDDSVIRLN